MSLFKKKDGSTGSPDSIQDQLAKISDQLVFLEKKIDTLLESRQGGGNGGGARRFGGPNRGGFNRDRGGNGNFRGNNGGGQDRGDRHDGNNTRFAGQGPTRYSSNRPSYGNGGGNRNHNPRHQGGRRPRPFGNQGPRPSSQPEQQQQTEQSSAE